MSKFLEHIQNILSNLPKTPWVYQMRDKQGKVMYVWKAKNLKNRVASYFMRTKDLTLAKKQMVAKINNIETIICATEVEALVLETNLIKYLMPKYNILMKDDRNLAYLKITNSPVPELIKTRQKFSDGATYFGPYVAGVEQSVRALRRIFKIRNCRVKFAQSRVPWNGRIIVTDKAGRTLPCIDYYIWLCPAPCTLDPTKIQLHQENIERTRQFLSWQSSTIFSDLENQMQQKARHHEFEEAQKIKETLIALRGLHERQKVRDMVDWDVDICIQYEKYNKTYIAITQLRGGQIIGVFRHEIDTGIDEWEDVMISFLMRQYIEADNLPTILLVTKDFWDEAFYMFLSTQGIKIELPKKWPKKDLLDFTRNQLREYAYKRELATMENKTFTRDHMANVLKDLEYPIPEKWEIVFECYDISHTDGHFTYASRVVIANGRPDPSRYRKYKIRTLSIGKIDDYASHREVMVRRTLEGIAEKNFPHLIIIDWWKWQLSSAIAGIKEWIWRSTQEPNMSDLGNSELEVNLEQKMLTNNSSTSISYFDADSGLPRIPICSIAKREEEIFIPMNNSAIIFEKGSPELMVLQKARDESHRFSITANRSARTKAMKKNILEELPGIGPITRKKLLKLAGSIDAIQNLSPLELSQVCNIAQIETLRDHGIIG